MAEKTKAEMADRLAVVSTQILSIEMTGRITGREKDRHRALQKEQRDLEKALSS